MDWKKVSIMTTEEGLEFLCYKLDEIDQAYKDMADRRTIKSYLIMD